MSYLVSKIDSKHQFRVYLDGVDTEGDILYKGHKMGITDDILSQIIDYRIERISDKVFFLKYNLVDIDIDRTNINQWSSGRVDTMRDDLYESWLSLNIKLKSLYGNYRKVIVTKCNI